MCQTEGVRRVPLRGRASGFVGLCCLSLWLQLGLQNLYVACTYADHVLRGSTMITATLAASLLVTLIICVLLMHRLSARAHRKLACFLLAVVLAILVVHLAFARFAGRVLGAPVYSIDIAIILACAAGVLTAVLVVLWGRGAFTGPLIPMLRNLLASHLVALVIVFAFFSWVGQVVWFDFPSTTCLMACVAMLVVAALGACFLCPVGMVNAAPAGEERGPRGNSADGRETCQAGTGCVGDRGEALARGGLAAWRNFALRWGRLLAGLVLFCFCATFHWEINAMRNGNDFGIVWTVLGHRVSATYMSACYLVLCASVLAFGLVLIKAIGGRSHPRTLLTALFYLVGCAFFVPGLLLGSDVVSAAGFTMVGMVLYCVCAFALVLATDRSMLGLPAVRVAGVFFALMVGSLGLGLLASWLIAPSVHDNDTFCMALTALSLFFVMTAPLFLFSVTTPSLTVGEGEARDPIVESCRRLASAHQLSPREIEVMELAARGYSAPAIASSLMISENTVKVHMRHIYEKLGVHTKQELIRLVEAWAPRTCEAAPPA